MSARGKARKEALDQLFQADLKGVALTSDAFENSRDYAKEILLGVTGNFARIDELIKSYIQGSSNCHLGVAVDSNSRGRCY